MLMSHIMVSTQSQALTLRRQEARESPRFPFSMRAIDTSHITLFEVYMHAHQISNSCKLNGGVEKGVLM